MASLVWLDTVGMVDRYACLFAIVWLTDWLVHWLFDWSMVDQWLINWLIGWLMHGWILHIHPSSSKTDPKPHSSSKYHEILKGPQRHPPKRNNAVSKVIIHHHDPLMTPLIRPYFLWGNVALRGGPLTFHSTFSTIEPSCPRQTKHLNSRCPALP